MAANFGGLYYSMNIYSSEILLHKRNWKGKRNFDTIWDRPLKLVQALSNYFSPANVIILLPKERLFGAETRSSEQLSCRYKSSHALQTETW